MFDRFIPRIGLDKITLHNILLRAIVDWTKLDQEGVKWNPPSHPSKAYHTERGEMIGDIRINEAGQEAKFKELNFGFTYGKFGNLTLTPRYMYGENFHNMTVKALLNYLLYLTGYLECTYGIVVDFTAAVFTEMEINTTIPLDNRFDDYRRVLLAIEANIPYYGRKDITRHDRMGENSSLINTGMHVGGNSFKIIVYDKTDDMHRRKEKLPHDVMQGVDYMRIEFRLLTTEKIRHIFSTADIGSITQDDIIHGFIDLFDQYIRRGYKKWTVDAQKILRSRVREAYDQRHSGKRQWISELFERLRLEEQKGQYPVVLDKVQLIEEVQSLPIGHGNRARTVKSIDRHMRVNDVFDGEGSIKIAEIFEKVDAASNNTTA